MTPPRPFTYSRAAPIQEIPTNYTPGDWSGQSLRRAAPDGRLISLDEARRMRQGSSVRPLNPIYRGGLVIPWPWAPQEPMDDDEEAPVRRQLGELERWLPTVVFCAVLVSVLMLVLIVRAVTSGPGESPASPASQAEPAPPLVEQIASASQPQAPQIRFSARPIEANYSVVPGDTLSAIAQRYNTTTAAVRGINNLADDAILSVGQRLVLP